MNIKKTTNILIFFVVAITLLLRPFFVYQIAAMPKFIKDQTAATSLLQRLIKKKDDHHCVDFQAYSSTQSVTGKTITLLPKRKIINLFIRNSKFLTVFVASGKRTIFEVCPAVKYYRTLSIYKV